MGSVPNCRFGNLCGTSVCKNFERAKVVVSRGECREKELGRVGPKTADPQGDRDPFRDTPHAESLLRDILKCPKKAASGCNFRRDCREHRRGRKSAFRLRSVAKTAATQFGMGRYGAGVCVRTFATLPMRNHNFWTHRCHRRRRDFIWVKKITRATFGTLLTRKHHFRTISRVKRRLK